GSLFKFDVPLLDSDRMRIKFFGYHCSLKMALLSVAATIISFGCCWMVFRKLHGETIHWSIPALQSLIFGMCVTVVMIAMGLFSSRLRDRMAGIILRITWSVGGGGILSALLLGLSLNYRL